MKKLTLYLTVFIVGSAILAGCGGEETSQPRKRNPVAKDREIEKPEEIKVPEFTYTGDQYRSPFSETKVRRSRRTVPAGEDSEGINPAELSVTGLFSDNQGKYAILSGAGTYYVVKEGRLYDEDGEEESGIAAIIKEDKIVLITDEDTMFELAIPE